MRRRDEGCCDTSFGVGAVWGSETLHALACQLSGPVGRMPSRWWARATQKFLLCWFVIWKATQTLPVWQRAEHAARALSGISNLHLGVHSCFGARPAARAPDTFEPGTQRQSWQHEAVTHRRVRQHQSFGEVPRWARGRALAPPPSAASPLLPVWPTTRLLWPPRAACAQAGVLGRRGWALGSVVARISREVGGRVTTNVMLRDLDVADGRKLEVVADGLPLG